MYFLTFFSLPNQQQPILQPSESVSLSVSLSGAMFGILDRESIRGCGSERLAPHHMITLVPDGVYLHYREDI